jgi:3(or 17)beta-hydroxysteroid dehydrogenase
MSGMRRFEGRSVMITGGASGIGAATARLMAMEGARVAIADRNVDLARQLQAEIGAAAIVVPLDVTDESSWQEACRAVVDAFGSLHVLVNSAGISVPANVEDATLEHWRQTMAINADGVFLGCKHGVATIKRFGGGAIVNLASTLGARPGAIYVAYSASKAAVLASRGPRRCTAPSRSTAFAAMRCCRARPTRRWSTSISTMHRIVRP